MKTKQKAVEAFAQFVFRNARVQKSRTLLPKGIENDDQKNISQ